MVRPREQHVAQDGRRAAASVPDAQPRPEERDPGLPGGGPKVRIIRLLNLHIQGYLAHPRRQHAVTIVREVRLQIAIWSISRLDEMNPQDLSNLCYAFSSAHRAAPRLFDGIAEAAVRRGLLSEFNPQDLSNTAFAYATVGHSSPELFAAIADAARHQLGRFTAQGFANTLWSYCVLGTEAPALFDAAADVLPDLLETLAGDTGFSAMMYQLFLFLQIEAPYPRLLMALAEYRDVWLGAFANAEVNASESQRDVSHALTALGWAHEVEYRTEDGLSLDMAQPSTKIAVEFDGPHHFNWGPEGPIFDGRTAFKRRLLAKLGWRVISVSHFDWDGRDGWTREAHLREHVLAATSMGLAPQN